MADLTITPANVVASATAVTRNGKSGATIAAGQIVYLDPADAKYKLLDADSLPSGGASAAFMALNGASNNQPITVLQSGDVTIGAVMTAGTTYCAADTAGAVAPQADLTTGDSVIVLGVAKSTSVLAFRPIISGVTL
jgi:hypothetical protein